MNKLIILFFFLCGIASTHAQNNAAHYDTIMLAVYNTGAKYRIAPADFGGNVNMLFNKDRQFIGELVAGNDTVHTWSTKKCDTCKNAKQQTVLNVSHGCNVVNGDLKDKVVVIDLGNCKDASKMALSAQKQGAKAVVFKHYEDDRDKISIKHNNDSDDKSAQIIIPVFSVRKTTGDKISAMLPSRIGIKEPKILPPDIQELASTTQPQADSLQKQLTNQNAATSNATFSFSPNPTDDLLYLRCHFDSPTQIKLRISTAGGTSVFSKSFEAASGEYEIDTTGWANGIYIATLERKGLRTMYEKIVVTR